MTQTDIEYVFSDGLDTFKAFDNLTTETSGLGPDEFPSSVWQILNHLLTWQAYQLSQLRGSAAEKHISEVDTWVSERAAPNDFVLQATVEQFKNQLKAIQNEISGLTISEEKGRSKLKVIQEISLHLSFHLGEVVLMRRMKGTYPLPHQMKEFLQK